MSNFYINTKRRYSLNTKVIVKTFRDLWKERNQSPNRDLRDFYRNSIRIQLTLMRTACGAHRHYETAEKFRFEKEGLERQVLFLRRALYRVMREHPEDAQRITKQLEEQKNRWEANRCHAAQYWMRLSEETRNDLHFSDSKITTKED